MEPGGCQKSLSLVSLNSARNWRPLVSGIARTEPRQKVARRSATIKGARTQPTTEYSTRGAFPAGVDTYGSKSLVLWWPGVELNHRHADFQNLYGLLTRRGLLFEAYVIQALSGNQGKLAEAHGRPKTRLLVQFWSNMVQTTGLSPRHSLVRGTQANWSKLRLELA